MWARPFFIGAPLALAIDGDVARAGLDPGLDPESGHEPLKSDPEGHRIQQPEDPAEGVVTGRARLKRHTKAQEFQFGLSKIRHLGAISRAAQRRHQRREKHIREQMPRCEVSRIGKVSKTVSEKHQTIPSTSREPVRIQSAPQRKASVISRAIPLLRGGEEKDGCTA